MRARQPAFREQEEGGRIIGIHNGTKVVSEFPLLDDGETTVAIIHYDVQPGAACKRAGGLVRIELVPGPASAVETPFCVPKVLVERNIRAGDRCPEWLESGHCRVTLVVTASGHEDRRSKL